MPAVSNGSQFYYSESGNRLAGPFGSFSADMRASPTCSIYQAPTYTNCTEYASLPILSNNTGWIHRMDVTSPGTYRAFSGIYDFDAEI